MSFAARAGQVVAAEIYMLLAGPDHQAAITWYRGSLSMPIGWSDEAEIAEIERQVHSLASYVCRRLTDDGERLRNWALDQAMGVPAGPWAEIALADRLAWTLFAKTCLRVFSAIDEAQAVERVRQAVDRAQPNPPVAREDTIFEETPSLGETIPGVLDAMAKSERERQRREAMAAEEARRAQARSAGWETKRMPKPSSGASDA